MTLNFDDHRPHDDFCCLGWMMVKLFPTDDLWRRRGIVESDLSQAVIPLQSVDYMTVWMLNISIMCITLCILVPVSRQHLIIILSSSRFDNWTSSDTWSGQKTPMLPTDHYMATPDEGDLAPTTSSTSAADRTRHGWTVGVGSGQGCLAKTFGRVLWPTATRLDRERGIERLSSACR